ncbi:MAG: porin family protein [Bacteroidia bacterium]|nr:porin family protein [Bacteroidia bacterium]
MIVLFGLWGLCLPKISTAQTHEVGLSLGVANYQGELSRWANVSSPGPHGGIFYRANLGQALSLRGSFTLSQISEDDANSDEVFAQVRNHEFRTLLLELAAQVEYNFFNFRGGRRSNSQDWTPYLFAGLALLKMEPLDNEQPTYETYSASIPLGVGIKAVLAGNFNIGAEVGARFSFTDYLDDLGLDVNSTRTSPLNPKYYTGNPQR